MTTSYKVIKHEYDVVIVGAGGAGLRAALGMSAKGLSTACISKVFPTRSHTVAAQGGISAALGNMGDDDSWQYHMYDTVKGSDWLGDQDAIEYMCRNAIDAVVELEHMGVPFSRTEKGTIYQRLFGGHTLNNGKSMAHRACAAADKTGHAILHTLYQQCLKNKTKFFIEFFVLDLMMNDSGQCTGVTAMCLEDGSIHVFSAKLVILATGGYGRVFYSCTGAHTCTGDGNGMILRAGLPLQDMEFVQFHPTGLYGTGCLISEGVRGEGGYLLNSLGERFMANYAPNAQDLASRDVVSRAIAMEINAGRGVGQLKDHIYLTIAHLSADVIQDKLPGIAESSRIFAGIDVTKDPIPVLPTVHYNMGGIPTNINCEVIDPNYRTSGNVVPGLMALGEAACVSVHGANRLGTNSLLDLIVFGRSAAIHAAQLLSNQKTNISISKHDIEQSIHRVDKLLHAKKGIASSTIRLKMQQTMQQYCSVFRTGDRLVDGLKEIKDVAHLLSNMSISDKSKVWNSDLIEALELENLMGQAVVTMASALNRTESRGAHSRDDFPHRNDVDWLKHTITWCTDLQNVNFAYRDVRMQPLTDEVQTIPLQDRTY